MPDENPRPPRSRAKDFWQLDVPLAVVLVLCTVITVIEYRRANEGVWRAWIYLFEWPMIAAFAIWIWYRFKHEGVTGGFVQRWKSRVAQYEAEADALERQQDRQDDPDDAELAAWRRQQRELRSQDRQSEQ